MQVLQLVQTKSKEQYPPDTMDDLDDFGLRLLGTEEDGAPNSELLQKLIQQVIDKKLSAKVKVCDGMRSEGGGSQPTHRRFGQRWPCGGPVL